MAPGVEGTYENAIVKVIRDFSADFAAHRVQVDNQLNVWNVAVRSDLNRAVASLNSHIASIDRISAADARERFERQKMLDRRLDNIDRHMRYLFTAVIALTVLSLIFISLMLYIILK